MTAKLLQQVYRYHNFREFYRRHYELISKYDTRLKTLQLQGLSKPEFYDELMYKFRKKNR